MKVLHPQQKLLDEIREGKSAAIKEVYQLAFKYCASNIIRNKGTMEDAKDLFQETLLVLMKKARESDFTIQHDLKSYLYTIMRNLWLKRLRKDRQDGLHWVIDSADNHLELVDKVQIEEKRALEEKHQELYDTIRKLKEDCQTLLKLTFFEKKDDKSIAATMDYSYQFVRQKRKRCVTKLRELMRA